MLETITKRVNEAMAQYNHSMQPTDDEIYLAWCIGEIHSLRKELNELKYADKRKIAFWADYTWCDYEDAPELILNGTCSDDFAVFYVPLELEDEEVDTLVRNITREYKIPSIHKEEG